MIATLTAEGVAVLAVFHDREAMLRLASRVVLMRDGRIAQEGAPAEILEGVA
jgi:alpha-D-ribose 1-methylphosphonate 5-triphosphate synthase subunit PhnL